METKPRNFNPMKINVSTLVTLHYASSQIDRLKSNKQQYNLKCLPIYFFLT